MVVLNKKLKLKLEYMAAAAAFTILACILFVRPIKGVADNGDFARIMNSTGLYYLSQDPEDIYFGFVNRLYGINHAIPFGGGYLSTQLPVVLLAKYFAKSISGSVYFDIRFLSIFYIVILTSAIFITARYMIKKMGIAGLIPVIFIILVFCDIGYTSYFNSLYGEPVTYVFLLLMASVALMLSFEEKPSTLMVVLFCTGVLFFSGAKVQNAPAGVLAAFMCIRLAGLGIDSDLRNYRGYRLARVMPVNRADFKISTFLKDSATGRTDLNRRLSMMFAIIAAIVSITCYLSVSREIKVCNKYQTVFYGILKGSDNPEGDLADLGLDKSLAVLANTNYFMEEYPIDIRTAEFKHMLFDKVNYTGIVFYYLKHPGRLIEKLERAAENGFKLKQGFGNYEKYPGISYKQTADIFSFWSDFKMKVLPHTLLFVFSFYLISLIVLFYEYLKAEKSNIRFLIEFLFFIVFTGIVQFVLPLIGDGEADLSKHLFLFNLSFDLLFSAAVAYITGKVFEAVRYFKNRVSPAGLQTE